MNFCVLIYTKKVIKNMFKVFKDKDRLFKCTVDVFGANIDECKARLIFEFDNQTLLYKGTIDNNGQCKVVIPKLKGFNEGESGKVTLEVIAENTLFESWNSNFEVSLDKKVSVLFENSDSGEKNLDSSTIDDGIDINSKKVSVVVEDDVEDDQVYSSSVIKEDTQSGKNDTKEEVVENKKVAESKNKNTKEIKKGNVGGEYIDEDVLNFDSFLKK